MCRTRRVVATDAGSTSKLTTRLGPGVKRRQRGSPLPEPMSRKYFPLRSASLRYCSRHRRELSIRSWLSARADEIVQFLPKENVIGSADVEDDGGLGRDSS
jgi:hypothetical protein